MPDPGVWREEVQARVAGYRSRRGRRIEGAFSMRFPFPPIETAAPEPEISAPETVEPDLLVAAEGSSETAATHHSGAEAEALVQPHSVPDQPDVTPALDTEFEPEPARPTRSRARRKVIPFPAPELFPGSGVGEAAAPPRILDVADELQAFATTPLLDGLILPGREPAASSANPERFMLPHRPVEISRRLYAGLVDCGLVLLACILLGSVSYAMLPKIALTKPVLVTTVALMVCLWSAYQYLFLVYRTCTPGMQLAGFRLSTFRGGSPGWRQRVSRVGALYFSTASLMMGLLWAVVDADALCWHDRISQTYPVSVR